MELRVVVNLASAEKAAGFQAQQLAISVDETVRAVLAASENGLVTEATW
jgi:hypothetical protein